MNTPHKRWGQDGDDDKDFKNPFPLDLHRRHQIGKGYSKQDGEDRDQNGNGETVEERFIVVLLFKECLIVGPREAV